MSENLKGFLKAVTLVGGYMAIVIILYSHKFGYI